MHSVGNLVLQKLQTMDFPMGMCGREARILIRGGEPWLLSNQLAQNDQNFENYLKTVQIMSISDRNGSINNVLLATDLALSIL